MAAAVRDADTPDRPAIPFQWQWEHKKGFRDYSAESSERIENAYQNGHSKVRLRLGKGIQRPMEIFFRDMIQHDAVTKNKRKIQRVGPDSRSQRWLRFFRQLRYATEVGEPFRMTFDQHVARSLDEAADAEDKDDFPLYSETGVFAGLARTWWFQAIAMCAVLLNAIWLGVDAQINKAPTIYTANDFVQTMENLFCFYFCFELAVRFCAYRHKRSCLTDLWFVFDALLLILMVGETWLLPLYLFTKGDDGKSTGRGGWSVLRLARLLRLIRVARIAPEVMILVKGFLTALKAVFFTMLLLIVIVYVFAIIFKTQSVGDPQLEKIFPDVFRAAWVLILQGVFMDGPTEVLEKIRVNSYPLTGVFFVFIALSSFTIMNMLIGILCNVIGRVTDSEASDAMEARFRANLLTLLEVYDKEGNQKLHSDEFDLFVRNPEVQTFMKRNDVNANDLLQLKAVLFEPSLKADEMSRTSTSMGWKDSDDLTFEGFVSATLRLRGANMATVSDIVNVREYLRIRLDKIQEATCAGPTTYCRSSSDTISEVSEHAQESSLEITRSPQMASDREFRDVVRLLAEQAAKLNDMETKQSLRHNQLMARQASLQEEVHALRKELKSLRVALVPPETFFSH